MDIHNIDEYLDLQDQNQMNLLSTEELTTQPEEESEWHSATAATTTTDTTPSLSEMLEAVAAGGNNNPFLFNVEHGDTTHHTNTEWGLLQNGLVDLQGINFIGNGGILVSNPGDNNTFITPDSLLKQQPQPQPTTEQVIEEKRVTRSRAAGRASPATTTTTTKKKKAAATRTKKLYCICQQPYNGKPMVQCDQCEEWFHCTCVEFDPDDQDEEDIDWVCKSCIEAKVENTPKEEPVIEVPKPITITIPSLTPVTSTRQTRGSSRNQSKCLYAGCNNCTRADSYCSDVCARKKKEADEKESKANVVKEEPEQLPAQRVTRRSKAALSVSTAAPTKAAAKSPTKSPRTTTTKKKSSPTKSKKEEDEEVKEEEIEEEDEDDDDEEEVEDEEEEAEGTNTPDTPMSPSQMTEEENPVRRNVIKNMSTILKTIIETALKDNPDLFDGEEGEAKLDTQERAEKLAKSIENTMLEQLGDMGKTQQRRRTCGEPYKSKFRSLLYNLKDKQNQVFQMRVITGDLTPLELVKMSSEDMANPELKSMDEVLRKTGLKNSVMKLDNTPIIKKTHKGDIIMVPNKDNDTNQNMYSEQVENINIDTKVPPSPTTTTTEHKTITSFSPNTTTSSGSKIDPLDDILARIGIPAYDESNKRNAADSSGVDYAKKRKVTLDLEELLGEEEETPFQVEEVDTNDLVQDDEEAKNQDEKEEKTTPDTEMTEKEQEEKLPTIWQGRVNMPQVAEFEASARQIGGRLLSETEWAEVLSPTMWIEGRIPAERVTSYVTQNQYSTSREIVLLEIEPDTTSNQLGVQEQKLINESQSQTLLKYLDSRQRYAVVGHNKTKVKDFYLIPLYKVQHIPDCLYVVRVEETKRECDLFLGVLVLTKQHHSPAVSKPSLPVSAVATQSIPQYSAPITQQQYSIPTPQTQPYSIPTPQSSYSIPTYQPQIQQQQEPQYGYGYHPSQTQQHQQQQQQPYRRHQQQQQYSSHNQQRHQYSSYNQRNNNNNSNNNSSYGSSHYRSSY